MDYTFVPQYNGEPPKRRRLAKACEACRARKKRCYHNQYEEDDAVAADADGQLKRSDAVNGLYKGISVQKGRSNRFLSDLSPETRLLERNLAEGESRQAKSMVAVGMWVNKAEYESIVKQRDAAVEAGLITEQTGASPEGTAAVQPSPTQLSALMDIFFERIHPLMPILDEAEVRRAHSASALPEPYLHAICLLAAKDSNAEEVLNSTEHGPTIAPRQLCRNLHASVKAALGPGAKYDKITQIRLLSLLSMHSEGSEGAEEASMHLMQAMHYCQTLGLHLSASFPDKDGKITKRIFWCVWILDRLAAVMNGRPILMADIDMAIEPFEPGESGFPAFEILLKIVNVMNEVIDFYRPGKDTNATGWESKFPGFDEIVTSVRGWGLASSLLSTLNIAYSACAILSHRSKGISDYPSTTPSYIRQSLAAIKIIRYMAPSRLRELHPLPVLPYAISLALSVSYQHMRQDQLQTQQEDAKADFESCLAILQDLRRTWSSVDAMYTLSLKVIDELNRVPDMASFRIRRPDKSGKRLEGFASMCKHDGEKVQFNSNTEATPDAGDMLADGHYITPSTAPDMQHGGLFEGIDDIFGTYLDPNYPVNLDFIDDLDGFASSAHWSTDQVMNNG